MKAAIITIGNEILKGRTVNTNMSEIGKFLSSLGFVVVRGLIVPDIPEEIGWAFRNALSVADLIISSGGLGPTFDDMTVESFSREFGLTLSIDQRSYEAIRERYSKMGLPLTPEREKMAKIPYGSKALLNSVGSAPGVFYKMDEKSIFILPGVPREMRSMLPQVASFIGSTNFTYVESSDIIDGIPESSVAPVIRELMAKYGKEVYIKSHPDINRKGESTIEIEVSMITENKDYGEKLVRRVLDDLKRRIDDMKNH